MDPSLLLFKKLYSYFKTGIYSKTLLFLVLFCSIFHSNSIYSQSQKNLCNNLFEKLEVLNKNESKDAYLTAKDLLNCINKKKKKVNSSIFYQIGLAYKRERKLDSTLIFYKKAENENKNINILITDIYREIADTYYLKGLIKDFKFYTQKQLLSASKQKDTSQIADAYFNLGFNYRIEQKLDSADFVYNKALKLSLSSKDSLMYHRIKISYAALLVLKNENFNALKILNELEVYFKKNNNDKYLGDTYFYMAFTLRRVNKLNEAIDVYKKVIPIYQKTNQTDRIAACYNNIGLLYTTLSNNESALNSYKKALSFSIDDLRFQCVVHNSITSAYIKLENFDDAFIYHKKAQEICGNASDEFRIAEWNRIAGTFYIERPNADKTNDYNIAILHLNKALQYFDKVNRKNGQINVLTKSAFVYQKNRDYNKAENYLKRAYAISQDLDNHTKKIVLLSFSEFYSEIKNYKKAFEFLEKYQNITDENFQLELNEKLNDNIAYYDYKLQVKQDSLKNDYRITLKNIQIEEKDKSLKSQSIAIAIISGVVLLLFILALITYNRNKLLKKAKRIIETQKVEVEVQRDKLKKAMNRLVKTQNKLLYKERLEANGLLTQNIAHELRNPLHFIKGASLALSRKKDVQAETKKTGKLLKIIDLGVDRMLHVLDGLNIMVNSQHNLTNIDLTLLTNKIVTNFKAKITKEIKLISFLSGKNMVFSDQSSLEKIITSIIQNAIDAIEGKGVIEIYIKEQQKTFVLIIKDNGKGMNEATLKKVFEPFYSEKKEVSSVGIGLFKCYSTIKAIGGNIEFKSEMNKGTQVVITINKKSFLK